MIKMTVRNNARSNVSNENLVRRVSLSDHRHSPYNQNGTTIISNKSLNFSLNFMNSSYNQIGTTVRNSETQNVSNYVIINVRLMEPRNCSYNENGTSMSNRDIENVSNDSTNLEITDISNTTVRECWKNFRGQ
ncbi:PREDICTED: uncharacterized protein LOC108560724 [Nicrophorus vespilloides]|uniref:Uncharacterized protein LOC108560724 n=1 Tax=Nicrophorus vespilloides TaxID=110193 RepID=A0ABM1MH30_NICVS|nr:PREDICTED: uncharacterized protein LOC108560724 [Nicrophorus vespilloides]